MAEPIFTNRRRYRKGEISIGDLVKVIHDRRPTAKVGVVVETLCPDNIVHSVQVLWSDSAQVIKCHDPAVLEVLCR